MAKPTKKQQAIIDALKRPDMFGSSMVRVPGRQPGLVESGNIDLLHRKIAPNKSGMYSTIRSISINDDGRIFLIPTVVNGRVVSDQKAIEHFQKTGEHLGRFASEAAANRYAEIAHNQGARFYQSFPQTQEKAVRAAWKRQHPTANGG